MIRCANVTVNAVRNERSYNGLSILGVCSGISNDADNKHLVMEEYINKHYPSRGEIRTITDKDTFYEIMFVGGETLYLKYDKV